MHAKFEVQQSHKKILLNYYSVKNHLAEICTLTSAFFNKKKYALYKSTFVIVIVIVTDNQSTGLERKKVQQTTYRKPESNGHVTDDVT